jgi:hypothetical protein
MDPFEIGQARKADPIIADELHEASASVTCACGEVIEVRVLMFCASARVISLRGVACGACSLTYTLHFTERP